jgi:recombinational DNA repair ATPase RecF
LDDIFSELDHKHREDVVKLVEKQVEQGGQVIMTTADEHLVPQVKGAKIIKL